MYIYIPSIHLSYVCDIDKTCGRIQIVTSPRGCELAVFASNHIGHSFDLSDYHDLIIIVLFWIDELHVVGVVDTGLTVKQADLQDVFV